MLKINILKCIDTYCLLTNILAQAHLINVYKRPLVYSATCDSNSLLIIRYFLERDTFTKFSRILPLNIVIIYEEIEKEICMYCNRND